MPGRDVLRKGLPVNVVALQPCWYRNELHKTGAHFSVDTADGKILKVLGKVIEAESASGAPADIAPRAKRRYRRRDLESEA